MIDIANKEESYKWAFKCLLTGDLSLTIYCVNKKDEHYLIVDGIMDYFTSLTFDEAKRMQNKIGLSANNKNYKRTS